MKAEDVKRTVNTAIEKAKLKSKAKPKLLSDNGSCYISNELRTYLKEDLKMKQVHGRPMHPQTQGKIERYHRTMKNVVKLNHFYHPEELVEALEKYEIIQAVTTSEIGVKRTLESFGIVL